MTDAAAQTYIGFIAVVVLVGAAVAHGFAHDWGACLGRQRLTPGPRRRSRARARRPGRRWALAGRRRHWRRRAGGVVITAYFLLGGVVITAYFLLGGVVITAYFLLGGVLFSTLGWRRGPVSHPAAPHHGS